MKETERSPSWVLEDMADGDTPLSAHCRERAERGPTSPPRPGAFPEGRARHIYWCGLPWLECQEGFALSDGAVPSQEPPLALPEPRASP